MSRYRQAVIFVHGQGEQRPMEAVRELARTTWLTDASLHDEDHPAHLWNTPDYTPGPKRDDSNNDAHKSSAPYELNRITSSSSKNSTRTDYYELYWAHLMTNTRVSHLWNWVVELSKSRVPTPYELVPVRRLFLWLADALVLVIAAYAAFSAISTFAAVDQTPIVSAIFSAIGFALVAGALGILVCCRWGSVAVPFAILATPLIAIFNSNSAALGSVTWDVAMTFMNVIVILSAAAFATAVAVLWPVLLPVMGDSARYLRATPTNIANRQSIREEGVKLLSRLHAGDRYDRIIVVAHSLGSVIAYDVLATYWGMVVDEIHGATNKSATVKDVKTSQSIIDSLKGVEAAARALETNGVDAFQNAQGAFSDALVEAGLWRVTDFITVGSPLAYAPYLLSRSPSEFVRRVVERELSTCPPQLEDEPGYDAPKFSYRRQGAEVGPNHGAVFAAVRWTNLHFSHNRNDPRSGDIIGGPVDAAPVRAADGRAVRFGPGVKNVGPLDASRVLRRGKNGELHRQSFAHNSYWVSLEDDATLRADPPAHIVELRKAMGLR